MANQKSDTLSLREARAIMVRALGLGQVPARLARKAALLDTIRRLGQLQIDTIHVVARSPYLVLFSRLGAYPQVWLDDLLREGKLFEAWSHAACFLPAEDFFLHEGVRNNRADDWWAPQEWVETHREGLDRVLEHVRAHGAVRSADFERQDGKRGVWWDWKFEKQALEYWFARGELMVKRRERFQRVYDLRERVIHRWPVQPIPELRESEKALAEKAVKALGIVRPGWVADYFRRKQKDTLQALADLREEGKLLDVRVEGWKEPFLVHLDNQPLLSRPQACSHTTLLSPFDPLTCDRRRARELFGFDYQLECYTPSAKRRYGYFSLPILRRGELAGRADCKANRQRDVFELRGIFLEDGVALSGELAQDVADAVARCADWHATPQVSLGRCQPSAFQPLLADALGERLKGQSDSAPAVL